MNLDFSLSPQEFFFIPGHDGGLSCLAEPPWLSQLVDGATIAAFAISSHDHQNVKIQREIDRYFKFKKFKKVVEFNSVPVVLSDVKFEHSFVSSNSKWILNGASGTRLRNRYAAKNKKHNPTFDGDAINLFSEHHLKKTSFLPVRSEALDLDFAVECRNTFNYYHFLTETLCQLCLLSEFDFSGKVFIHSPSSEIKGFVTRFVEGLFPELRGRVKFEKSPKDYSKVISSFNTRHFYHQCGEELMPSIDGLLNHKSWLWHERRADRASQGIIAMNSFDSSLKKLRNRGHELVKLRDYSYLPKRFWVARDEAVSRVREMKNEDKLYAALREFGFSKVKFEDFDPLEQIALMQNAEVMMSYHGAGFANMIFANSSAYIIEIGNLQTASHRWADFMPHAHVAKCNYTSFFADFNTSDPSVVPSMKDDGLVPVAISAEGITSITEYLRKILK